MRTPRRIALGVAIALLLLVATLAMPVDVWRTGELPSLPLPLIEGGPSVAMSSRVWIDTDAACGAGRRVDADDCLALLVLARSGRPIAGVSAVHGNADIETVALTLERLQSSLSADGPALPAPYRGAANATSTRSVHPETRGRAALRTALEQGPLTIVALGPLTNIAAALDGRPDLMRNVARVVAVMGRRKGHLFHPSESRGGGTLFGHGPVFRDFNFVMDRPAAQRLASMRVPMTLVPYEAARSVVVTAHDLARMQSAGGASAWVASQAGAWLEYWRRDVGVDGFYPFDALAALYAIEPQRFDCAVARLWIESPSPVLDWLGFGETLYVGVDAETPRTPQTSSEVVYCPRARAGSHDRLMALLVARGNGS